VAKKSPFKTAEFKAQKKHWDAVLAAEGLGDIGVDTKYGVVITPQIFTVARDGEGFTSEYFELCQEILNNYEFKRDIDREIFEKHMMGWGERKIAAWLKEHSYRAYTQQHINRIINKIKSDYTGKD